MPLADDIRAFAPANDQEEADRTLMLERLATDPQVLDRVSPAHFTASAWTVDAAGARTLLVYHRIYDSWSWVGGHADGEEDLATVARRELEEETGVSDAQRVNAGLGGIFSLEVLPVVGHMHHGIWVSSHAHLNVTYLFVADPAAPVRGEPAENAGVRWAPLEGILTLSSEPWMCEHVYAKLIERTRSLLGHNHTER